ncbi:hypothetical protein [Paraburkholderia silvatlantica]|uniref:hypothetical protein n=1 Tax=Paraburkholderia silvatlantica TaxID=321895 RepID=UPI00105BF0A7|nr:hypothetical protein [Paraburkholderia silvatlantica]TDQ93131.1 hypothetical protein C7412_109111 [Paraburkholderia silvatlantica]
MFISILLTIVSTVLLMLQFIDRSQRKWYIAPALSVILLGLSVCSIWEQNKYQEEQNKRQQFSIASLEKMGTRINWKNTEVSVGLLNDPQSIAAQSVSVQMKILPPEILHLPNNGALDLKAIKNSCLPDPVNGIGYLPSHEAENIFNAFARDGVTSFDQEAKSGIMHLIYSGRSVRAGTRDNDLVQMGLDLLPNARSRFTSLSDLNGVILIALVQGGSIQNPWFSSLSMQLATAQGEQRFDFPIHIWDPHSRHSTVGSQYVGICVPQEYFDVNR